MSIERLMNQPLTIERRGTTGKDDYNNDVIGTTATVSTVGYVDQTTANEITVDRETYMADWRVFLAAGTPVDGSDRIIHGSQTLEVIGPPHEVWNPRTQRIHHVELRCREVT